MISLLDDFTLITDSFPQAPYLNIYPIGDVHIGSKECNIESLEKWVKAVESDPYGVVVIIGDLMNMGLKTSKSNIYEEVLSPLEQKKLCYEIFKPIAPKIIAGVSGNHEYRNVKEVGTNPLYDIFCLWGIEDRYRENICFVKLSVGHYKNHANTYGIVLTHGASRNKDLQWSYAVDGADIFISGHTHLGTHDPLTKIKMDLTHNVVKKIPYQHIVVTPFQEYGGYSARGKYKPNNTGGLQTVWVSGKDKRIKYSFEQGGKK